METFDKYLAIRSFVLETEKIGLVYGTSFSEFLILKAIASEELVGIRRVDLAEAVGLSVSGVTRALAPLEKLGYIDTLDASTDARVRRVTLTRTGAELFADMENDVDRRMVELRSPLQKMLRETNV